MNNCGAVAVNGVKRNIWRARFFDIFSFVWVAIFPKLTLVNILIFLLLSILGADMKDPDELSKDKKTKMTKLLEASEFYVISIGILAILFLMYMGWKR